MAPPARRKGKMLRYTILLTLVAACVLMATLFAIPDVRDAIIANTPLNTFSAFGSSAGLHSTSGYLIYRVRANDTIESIAQQFNVTIGGIYKLNGFYLGEEISVGEDLKIPNDPVYGANYQPTAPTLPTGSSPAYPGAPAGTIFGACVFCSIAGYSTQGLCALPSQTYRGFGLIQPEPNARFIRGFTWYHNGVDLSTGVLGTPIVAAQDGQVIFSGWDNYGFGYAIKINHCWGLSTSYGHLERLNVRVGQFVHKGDVIGLQGSTGDSTGPHLHFMVWWQNKYVDPLLFYDHLGFPY
jgi:murein DD-endopeptidase MepM/ murein hydrolase activator NlpD